MRFAACVICFLFLFTGIALAGETVTYHDGETALEGYWAPSACEEAGPAPVVLIVHQWKGQGEYEKRRADMLAAECYNAFAVDMYGKGVRPQSREEAAQQAGKYKNDSELARRRIRAALDYARSREDVRADKIAAMGYCFGGTMALELARSGADVKGVISFHGGLGTPMPVTEPGAIKAAIQVHHGAADPNVPANQVETFKREMEQADADLYFSSYADAVHSFTEKEAGDDPSDGSAYNEMADRLSWAATLAFLDGIFSE